MKKFFYILMIAVMPLLIQAQQTAKTIDHDGITRDYIEYVPSIYDGSVPVPIVICLHGLGDNMTNFSNLGFQQIADTANFIVLTPQALEAIVYSYNMGTAWNSGASYMGIVLNNNVDDLGFIEALIDTTASLYNVDLNSVFVTGFSMGGFMCHRLARELTDKITAIASVSGTNGNTITATPSHPIPVLHFHGTADGTVSYTGNQYGDDPEQCVSYWVVEDGCDMTPAIDSVPDVASDGKSIVHYTYGNGWSNTEVEFYKVIGGDHEWLSTPQNDLDYTRTIWKFFRKYKSFISSDDKKLNRNENIDLYPNPANDVLHINMIGDDVENSIVNLYNYIGEKVYSDKCSSNTLDVNVKDFKSGIYFIKYSNQNREVSKKLLILHEKM